MTNKFVEILNNQSLTVTKDFVDGMIHLEYMGSAEVFFLKLEDKECEIEMNIEEMEEFIVELSKFVKLIK